MVSHKFMVICLVSGVICTLLTGIALISADNNTGTLKNLSWSKGYHSAGGWDNTIYVGIYEYGQFVTGNDDYSGTVKYTDQRCNDNFCDKCDSGMSAVLAFTAIFFISSIPSLVSDYLRFSGSANTNVMRWLGIIFNVICILAGAIGMITFVAGCQKAVEDDLDNFDLDWTYGPSFGMLAASTVLKFVELIFCFLIGAGEGLAAAANQK